MFSFFKRKVRKTAKIYKYRKLAEKMFFEDVLSSINLGPVVLICPFEETFDKTCKKLQESNILYSDDSNYNLTGYSNILELGKAKKPLLLMANSFHHSLPSKEKRTECAVKVLVNGYHPLPEMNDKIEALANSLPFRSELAFYTSFESPLLKAYDSAHILDLLKNMGMTENECYDGGSMARVLRNASTKLSKLVVEKKEVYSEDEWSDYYLKELPS